MPMKKICPRCGIIFEVTSDPVFCSGKCKTLFNQAGFFAAKGSSGLRNKSFWDDGKTEIFKGKGIRPAEQTETKNLK